MILVAFRRAAFGPTLFAPELLGRLPLANAAMKFAEILVRNIIRVSRDAWRTTVNDRTSVVLTGFPEHVQRIADAIDTVMPGEITWDEAAEVCRDHRMMLVGRMAADDTLKAVA